MKIYLCCYENTYEDTYVVMKMFIMFERWRKNESIEIERLKEMEELRKTFEKNNEITSTNIELSCVYLTLAATLESNWQLKSSPIWTFLSEEIFIYDANCH